tara:strand:- start:2106 stop:2348 length:243 start_codon:yes stop_codon:yes gene_type:complete
MKRVALESLKIVILFFGIVVGVIICADKEESVEAKARKVFERKGNIRLELTRAERNEYMEYLRTLNDFDYEDPIFTKTVE